MTLYNDFREQMVENNILKDFINVVRQDEQTKGYIIFVGLPENYCKFKQSEVKWNESIYHREEAKVVYNYLFGKMIVISEYWVAIRNNIP